MPRKINPNSLKNLEKRKPFVKDDPRINRAGRVSSFDQLREYLQSFLDEEVGDKTRLRKLLEEMSRNKQSYKDLLEFGFGKVPLSQIVDITSGGKPLNWKSFIDGSDSDTNSETSSK